MNRWNPPERLRSRRAPTHPSRRRTAGQMTSAEPAAMEQTSSDDQVLSVQEKQRIMGLGVRDLKLSHVAQTLADVLPRQLAYVFAGIYTWLLPSDLLEVGGESDTCMCCWSTLCYGILDL